MQQLQHRPAGRVPATGLTLRPATAADEALLRRVYGSTRSDELAAVPWTEAEKAAFLDQQFHAQDTDYRSRNPDADFLVVEVDGEPVGRLYRWRRAEEIRIMDIALLPGWRSRGLGTRLLTDVLAEARAGGLVVSLHVEAHNPARRLYARLGFTEVVPDPVHTRLEWRAPG